MSQCCREKDRQRERCIIISLVEIASALNLNKKSDDLLAELFSKLRESCIAVSLPSCFFAASTVGEVLALESFVLYESEGSSTFP